MPNIGPLEIIIVLVIVLVIFGPKRLPELGRSMGHGLREFKDSVTGKHDDKDSGQPHELEGSVADEESVTEKAEREKSSSGS